MKQLFSIFIIVISAYIHAQDSIQVDTTSWKKQQLGITYSTDYTFRLLEADTKSMWIKEIADSMEAPKYGFATGIQYSHAISKKTNLTTGAFFTNNGEKTKNNVDLQVVNYTNHYYFVAVPVRLDYVVIAKKVDIYTTFGLIGNFFLEQKTVLRMEDKKDAVQFTNRTSLSSFNLGAIAGVGMQAKLADHWLFKLEALYKRSVTPVNNDPVKKWLYALGTNFGLYYSFN
jgi:hypothetical protein